jgi:hypothetical protein
MAKWNIKYKINAKCEKIRQLGYVVWKNITFSKKKRSGGIFFSV